MGWVVAFDVLHEVGRIQGVLDGPGQTTGVTMNDLHDVHKAMIRSFDTATEAWAWLVQRRKEEEG